MPMEVGPFSPPNRTVTGWAADLSPSSMGIGVFGVTQAHSVNASVSASSRDIIFFMLFSPFYVYTMFCPMGNQKSMGVSDEPAFAQQLENRV